MFAVTHAATALPLKRQAPRADLWSLLIAVQAIELLWVVLTYAGIEHIVASGGRIHLGFLPYSHSVGSTLALAAVAWVVVRLVRRDAQVAWVIAIAIVSHVVLDIIQHEPDIQLLPMSWGPRLGLGLTLHPWANAVVEAVYGILCWQVFGGSRVLLAALLALNALDWPILFAPPGSGEPIARQPTLLTTLVLAQIVVSWITIWALARRRAAALAQSP